MTEPDSKPIRLSIVIPARNEADRIGPTLDAYLAEFNADTEFIIVVNNSTDGTLALAKAYEARHPNLRALHYVRLKGKGEAVHKGFAASRGAFIGFVDADGSTPPAAFADLLAALDASASAEGRAPGKAERKGAGKAEADLPIAAVIASRWLSGSQVLSPQPLSRRLASRWFNVAVRFLFRLPYRDTQCGAKLFRAGALHSILPQLENTGWLFDIELLLVLRAAGYRVVEIPTTWRDVEGSRFSMGRNLGPVLKDLWSLRCRLRDKI